MNYRELLTDKSITIQQALLKLNNTAKRIIFITEDDDILTAALVDGDIRRYLISGGGLNDSVDCAANHNPIVASNLTEAKALFDVRKCIAVPIIDPVGKILDIYTGDEPEGKELPVLNIPVVINAGGKGTRLDPYTRILPKPLIPVGELPVIEHIMRRFIKFGCTEFHVIVNHKKEIIKSYFEECERKYDIRFYDEEKPLNTGGGLYLLKDCINGAFFFNNCDTLIQADYGELLNFHNESESAITMVCANKNVVLPYGVVEVGENGEIEALKEKPHFSFATNTGLYVVDSSVISDIEENVPQKFTDIIEKQRLLGKKTSAFLIDEDQWLDMGTLPELERMRERIDEEK